VKNERTHFISSKAADNTEQTKERYCTLTFEKIHSLYRQNTTKPEKNVTPVSTQTCDSIQRAVQISQKDAQSAGNSCNSIAPKQLEHSISVNSNQHTKSKKTVEFKKLRNLARNSNEPG
jgi:hypothetical protein